MKKFFVALYCRLLSLFRKPPPQLPPKKKIPPLLLGKPKVKYERSHYYVQCRQCRKTLKEMRTPDVREVQLSPEEYAAHKSHGITCHSADGVYDEAYEHHR